MRLHHFETLEGRRLLSFSVGDDYAISGYANSVAVGDFNNDARADFAVATEFPDNIRLMLGNANGTLTPGAQLSPRTARSLAAADVNGDGKLDLVGTPASSWVNYFAGNGNGTFQPPQGVSIPPPPNPPPTYTNTYYGLTVIAADVNADGKADLIVPCQYEYIDPEWDPDSPYPPQTFNGYYLAVLRGNGNGTFATAFIRADTAASDVEAQDLNGDGKLDLVLAWGGLNVLLGVGNGTFSAGPSYYWGNVVGNGDASLALADFNGDGKIDLATSRQNLNVAFGDGNGGFAPPVSYPTGPSWSRSLATADFNLDGRPDLVAGNYGTSSGWPLTDGKISILLNNGGGGFLAPLIYQSGPSGNYAEPIVAAADFNGDGRPDIAATSFYGRPAPDPSLANIRLLVNDGSWPVKTWIGPSGGNWSTAGNWNPSGVPAANDHVLIGGGRSVTLSSSATVQEITLSGGAKLVVGAGGNRVLRASTISIDATSSLDLQDNKLILDYQGSSPLSDILALLSRGREFVPTGILSSKANASAESLVLGVAEASKVLGITGGQTAVFAGQFVDATTVLIKHTVKGDLNLDGSVSIADFITLSSNFGKTSATYSDGDLNFDGAITIADFIDLAANFSNTLPPPAPAVEPQPLAAESISIVHEDSANLMDSPTASRRRKPQSGFVTHSPLQRRIHHRRAQKSPPDISPAHRLRAKGLGL